MRQSGDSEGNIGGLATVPCARRSSICPYMLLLERGETASGLPVELGGSHVTGHFSAVTPRPHAAAADA